MQVTSIGSSIFCLAKDAGTRGSISRVHQCTFLCRSVYPQESHSIGVEMHPDKLKTSGYNSNSEIGVFFSSCEQCELSVNYRTSETTLGFNTFIWKWGLWGYHHHSHHRGDDGDVIGCSVHRPWHYDRPGFCHHRVPQPSNEDVMTVPM